MKVNVFNPRNQNHRVAFILHKAVASLTVSGGQEFHFPKCFLKFWSILLTFPQTFLIFFLILALQVGESPTQEGPGYATDLTRKLHLRTDVSHDTQSSRMLNTHDCWMR